MAVKPERTLAEYADIIHLPHHTSPVRPSMSMVDRGAQFSPFAALTGYSSLIEETERLVDSRPVMTEEGSTLLDEQLNWLTQHKAESPEISVIRFIPDEYKEGGSCRTITGHFKRISEAEQLLFLKNGISIPLDDIISIDIPEAEESEKQP